MEKKKRFQSSLQVTHIQIYAEYWKVPFPIFSILCVSGGDNVPGPDGPAEDKPSLIYLHSCRFTPGQRFPLLPSSINLPLPACLPSLSSSSPSVFAFICLAALVPTSRGCKSGRAAACRFTQRQGGGGRERRRPRVIGGAE